MRLLPALVLLLGPLSPPTLAIAGEPDPIACAIAADDPTDGNLAACHGISKPELLAMTFMGEPAPAASRPVAPVSWSAGWEEAYLRICRVTPEERAAWASPVVTRIDDRAAFADGYDAAWEDVAHYDDQEFDAIEWCGDNHP